MVDFFKSFNPITQAFLATLFTWGMTALGANLFLLQKRSISAYWIVC